MASRKPLVNVAGTLSEIPASDQLTVAGIVESTSGGFKFPDNSVQTTAFTGGANTTGQGTATLDFGSWPGNNEASVAVTGQTNILATSKADVYIMADDTTSDHTANDHRYLGMFCTLCCGTPTAATGFTIYALSQYALTGTFKVRWVWAT